MSSAKFEGFLMICLFACFQFALVALGVVTLGNIPPSDAYYDSCCVPRSCQLLSSDELPGQRSNDNMCVLSAELAGKSGCPAFAAQGGNGTCALTPGSCPKPSESDQPFGRGVLISQSVFAILQGFLTISLAAVGVLATRKRAPNISQSVGKCIGIVIFSLATVASLITTISGLGIYILWGTKSVDFASETPRTVVGTQCTYNGEPADRYVAETVPLLQNLSVVMLFMSGFCLVGYVLLCCIGGIMQYSESKKKKKTAAAVEAERPPAAVTTTGDVQIRLASEEPAAGQVPTATTVETNPYRTDTA